MPVHIETHKLTNNITYKNLKQKIGSSEDIIIWITESHDISYFELFNTGKEALESLLPKEHFTIVGDAVIHNFTGKAYPIKYN